MTGNGSGQDPMRSARLLAAVVEAAPTAIVMIDAQGRIALVNAQTEKLFGHSRETLLGAPVEMLAPARFRDDLALLKDAFLAPSLGDGRDLYGVHRDGREFPVEIALRPIETEDGVFVLSFVVDIAERQRLEEQQSLLGSFVESVEDYAIFLLDLEGRVTTWNVGSERIKGYRADEIIGRHISCFFTPEDVAAGRPEAELATARAAGRYASEGWRVRADGSRFWALVTMTALRDAAGELVGYSKITRDLTEQRLAEQRFRATIESAPTAMVMTDYHGTIALLNAETEKLFGYERNELLHRSVELLLPERFRAGHPALREAFFGRPEARPMGAGRELYGRRKDGSEFPVEIGLSPVETDQGVFVLSAIVDITARKRLEASQRRLNQELEERVEVRTAELAIARDAAQAANLAKSQFVANMSHEIRTPLNAVIGLTEAVLRTELSAAQRDHLRTVMNSGEALLDVINDILDFSKIEVGKLALERVPFDLEELVSDTLRSQAVRAEGKGVELVCRVDPGLVFQRVGDPSRLRQTLTNLIGNAIKFTERGEVVVRVEREGEGDRLRFSVRDTGVGIDPGQLDRLFEPFEQADASTTRRHGGTGLGLAISRQLVELMGGEIGARSEPGAGSCFFFCVELAALPQHDRRRTSALAGRSALAIEANAASREALIEILTGYGLRSQGCATVADGLSALVRAADAGDRVDFVLLDARCAHEVAEGLRRDPRLATVKRLCFGSLRSTLAGDASGAAGIDARLAKPVSQVELIAALGTLLRDAAPAPGTKSEARLSGRPDEVALRAAAQRILVVEDSLANQKVVRAILAGSGHALEFASNGREALDLIAGAEFDLVLMDVQMPEMDGLEATEAVRAEEAGSDRHIQIVAMTAHAMQGDREKCLAAGMDHYISKPLRRTDLLEAIERAKDLAALQ